MRALRALLLAGSLLVVACGGTELPRDRYYRLQASPPAEPLPAPALAGSLRVAPLRGDGLTRGTALLYSDAARPSEVRRYPYLHWVDSPPAMLQRSLTDYLRAVRVADVVLPSDASMSADWVVSGRIRRIERLVTPASANALLEVELALARGSHREPVLYRRYREEHPVDAARGVVGMNAALSGVLERFVADIEELNPTRAEESLGDLSDPAR